MLLRKTTGRSVAFLAGCVVAGCSSATPPGSPPTDPAEPARFVEPAATPAWIGNQLRIGGGEITLDLSPGRLGVDRDAVQRWIATAADAVTHYFGRYSVKRVVINVVPTASGKVHGGRTYDGRFIRIHLGRGARESDLANDWMMTHEMFHLGFPDLDDDYLWMQEGLSDYLEPLARARIGALSAEEVWGGFVEGMPQGQPERGDQGLDNTHTWGRTYWGGCIYWLLVDLKIRQQTSNHKSVDDAIRAILDAGGDGSVTWRLDKVLDVGDRATGTTALKDIHDELGAKPVKVDLDAIWARLGVRDRDGKVTFDDAAPLAAIRRSMTAEH